MKILEKFKLPCGALLANRIAKAAMTERLAYRGKANQKHFDLYSHWAGLDTGLLITGNIMVDGRYKESGGNIVLENEEGLPELKTLTEIATKQGRHIWAQINHAGRQATLFSTFKPIAPSSVKLKKLGLFAKPRAMTPAEIADTIDRYVNTAVFCQKAGFTGVQIHAAHGYLLSQFLSPRTNIRTDEYGGSIENRSRILVSIIEKCRKALGASYPISVKINSADFQKGGFEEEDALFVIKRLEELGVDLLEISGGTYENIVFLTERIQRESTRKREAYFLDFAKSIRHQTKLPLMVTGGFRSLDFCNQVLENNELDIIGFARPYLIDERFPNSLLEGEKASIKDATFLVKPRMIADMAEAGFYDYQIHRLANKQRLNLNYSAYAGVIRLVKNEMIKGWF